MAIDYGSKKCGIAVSDPLRIIASPLDTVPTHELFGYLEDYFEREPVGTLVMGESRHKDGSPTNIHQHALGFSRKVAKRFPELEICWQDEALSSIRAMEAIRESGVPRKKRREKGRVDRIAAVIILQDFMEELR